MTHLPQTTKRRLKKIQQIPSIWEGDRRSLSGIGANLEPNAQAQGECIIWVDGSEGFVRAMDVVPPEMGPEAMVRTLLRAIENPHSPAKQARPQKIIVRDREIQFFLRGALQNLDIAIDYVPKLPLIDELFRGFEGMEHTELPSIPPQYEDLLVKTAYEIWNDAPWKLIADHDILTIELKSWDVSTIYVCVMGMLGREYGLILYRSLDSLKRFRSAILAEESIEKLEAAFLDQDCWFLNFEQTEDSELEDYEDEDEDEEFNLADLPISDIRPVFGSIHPYEGMRPSLDEEEALTIYIALKGFKRFCQASKKVLAQETISEISKNYRISLPEAEKSSKTVSLQVSTMPQLASELLEMSDLSISQEFEDSEEINIEIREDLVPEDSFLSLGMLPWQWVEMLRGNKKKYYQSQGAIESGEGIPVVLIQTSLPKAKVLIENIQDAGGLKAICFNPGEDTFTGITYDLGLFQTGNDNLYLFGEFISDESDHIQAMKKWKQRCRKTNGYCALIVARGLKGSSRGNPQPKDMMALFEAKSLKSKELGMGVLQLMPQFDFELK